MPQSRLVKQRRLGRDGPRVSEIGFGAWALGGNAHGNSYGTVDDAESVRAVRRALDLGCTFFDTADVYGWGHSEEILGQALEGRRGEVVLATKVGGDFYHGGVRLNFSPNYIQFAVWGSLKRLRTDYLDLYQLHNPPYPLLADPKLYETLQALQDAGTIRHFGVSIHDPTEGLAVLSAANVQSLQVVYNLVHRAPEVELFPAAQERGVGVIAREPLWNGFLAGAISPERRFEAGDIRSQWPETYRRQRNEAASAFSFLAHSGRTLTQSALAFVLAHDAVSTVIPGCKTVTQVEENFQAAAHPLQRTELEEAARVFATLLE